MYNFFTALFNLLFFCLLQFIVTTFLYNILSLQDFLNSYFLLFLSIFLDFFGITL